MYISQGNIRLLKKEQKEKKREEIKYEETNPRLKEQTNL